MADKKTTKKTSKKTSGSVKPVGKAKRNMTFYEYARTKGHKVDNGRIVDLSTQEFGRLKRKFLWARMMQLFRGGFYLKAKLTTKGGLSKDADSKNQKKWNDAVNEGLKQLGLRK